MQHGHSSMRAQLAVQQTSSSFNLENLRDVAAASAGAPSPRVSIVGLQPLQSLVAPSLGVLRGDSDGGASAPDRSGIT